ncbi:MAG: MAPEG family protein [Methylophilaceae bacterium]
MITALPVIVPFYAALLGILFIVLSSRVIKTRRQERIAIGDGDNPRLQRAIAVHNNFAQYVPLALLLLMFVEMQQAPVLITHVLCLFLLVARLLHAYGVGHMHENFRFRSIAMFLTFSVIGLSAVFLLAQAVYQMFY